MNDTALQARLDQLRATGAQRWLLAAVAIVAATLAAAAGEFTADGHSARMVVVVIVGAAVAAAIPDSHAGFVVIAIVTLRWALAVDDVTTPWALAVAIGLLMFHTVIALMAVTPPTANIDRRLLQRWLRRTGWIALATTVVWTLATTLQRQQLAGTAPLTFAALAALTIAIVAALLGTRD